MNSLPTVLPLGQLIAVQSLAGLLGLLSKTVRSAGYVTANQIAGSTFVAVGRDQ